MQKDIIKVDLILENCEVVSISGGHIGYFEVSDIKHSIRKVACNCITEIYTCKKFYMSVQKGGGKFETTWSDKNTDPLKRIITYPDIASICIYSNNKETPKEIYVNWVGDSDNANEIQKSCLNQHGDLFIVIDKKKHIYDIFETHEKVGV